MKTYCVTFGARTIGALGYGSPRQEIITLPDNEKPDKEKIQLSLYDKYEHIHSVKINEVTK